MAGMNTQDTGRQPTGMDQVLQFSIPARDARGRALRLGPVLNQILAAHDYPPPVKAVLAEALMLAALMGSLLKEEDSQLTLQAQSPDGAIELLVCDYRNGELRGYARHDADRVAVLPPVPVLEDLFDGGHLAITFDLPATGERYQGVVPLEGEALADAVQSYFVRSEQVPTLIRVAVAQRGGETVAGGLLVQHLPDGEEGRERLHVQMDHEHWEHVSILSGSVRADELTDLDLSLEQLTWRLFHEEEEVRVLYGTDFSRGCRCSIVHFEDVLSRFPAEDRREMRDDNGIILVDCAFCSKEFAIQD